MGDVNATLYGNESDYNFNVLKGNVSVNNIENPQNKDGKYYFKTDCSMGEINFIFKKKQNHKKIYYFFKIAIDKNQFLWFNII